jgi:hypothetical protein
MKKLTQLTGLLSFMFSLTCCISPGNEIKKAFDTVNKSFALTNAIKDKSLSGTYLSIDSLRKKDEQLASKADAIYSVTLHTTNFIDSVKNFMMELDSSGGSVEVPGKLLVNTKTGNDIAEKLLNVNLVIATYHADATTKATIDSALQPLKEIRTTADWTKFYFSNTPTIAARTVLSKYENDCKEAALLALSDIKRRLSK